MHLSNQFSKNIIINFLENQQPVPELPQTLFCAGLSHGQAFLAFNLDI